MRNVSYEWERHIFDFKGAKNLNDFKGQFGIEVLSRDYKGFAEEVLFKCYFGSSNLDVYLIGDFNGWEENLEKLSDYRFNIDDKGYGVLKVKGVFHRQKYKFLVVQDFEIKYLQDPSGVYFDDDGNCIFWDFEDPNSYKLKYEGVLKSFESNVVLQSDLPGLIVNFRALKGEFKGKLGSEVGEKNYFRFIASSGVVDEVVSLGFNCVQFLPFAQSIDGSNWKYSYLVPFLYAIQKNWGNPDDFKMMIDEFHRQGVGVIQDSILSHFPDNFRIFGQDSKFNGVHLWKNDDGDEVYVDDWTCWGTRRPRYSDNYIRDFLIESCIFFMKEYKIDGFRVDNIDGILRFGENGEGEDRPFGRELLRNLSFRIYEYNPQALISFEAHYFYEDNAKMLVAPLNLNSRSLGATCYNESRQTHYFHSKYMLKRTDEISAFKFSEIIEEKEWGKSSSTMSDFHNHDAAAGLMSGRATGAYAIECMLAQGDNEENFRHCVEKIKVMEALCAFLGEGRVLDLLQTFLLQRGSFEHNCSIEWDLMYDVNSRSLVEFKKDINFLLHKRAFWPLFAFNRRVLNVDDSNKVLTVSRSGIENGKKENYIILINCGCNEVDFYRVGVIGEDQGELEVVFDSKKVYKKGFKFKISRSFAFKDLDMEIVISLKNYQILVLKQL